VHKPADVMLSCLCLSAFPAKPGPDREILGCHAFSGECDDVTGCS
jgi:hypothetical protein